MNVGCYDEKVAPTKCGSFNVYVYNDISSFKLRSCRRFNIECELLVKIIITIEIETMTIDDVYSFSQKTVLSSSSSFLSFVAVCLSIIKHKIDNIILIFRIKLVMK